MKKFLFFQLSVNSTSIMSFNFEKIINQEILKSLCCLVKTDSIFLSMILRISFIYKYLSKIEELRSFNILLIYFHEYPEVLFVFIPMFYF
jgi:hypothetical protein